MRAPQIGSFDFLRRRKRNYQLALTSPAGQEVLKDLVRFCRGAETTYDPDPRVSAALEGRREVWLRIQQHLNLTDAQLFGLYTGQSYNPLEEDTNETA